MRLKENTLAILLRKKASAELIFILSIDFGRNVYGKNYIAINYSEVYGSFEKTIFFEDISYLQEAEMTEDIKKRLIQKYGRKIAK